jgi:hypothetical protein
MPDVNALSEWIVHGTTLSNYLRSCRDCDINNFKRNPHLTAIWEHCSEKIALQYLSDIVRDNAWLLDHKFTNDHKGNADVKDFVIAQYSTSTIQYIGVLSNLIKHFGPLDGMRICEIGGGYGGQARTILDIYKPACYHIIDLPEVCHLIDRYIPEVDTFVMPTGQEYDLVISNYALSEIRDSGFYVRWVCKKSKHGYVTCNTNFLSLPFEHIRVNDVKGERESNFILIW